MFASLNSQQRENIISQLWLSKSLRYPEEQTSSLAMPFNPQDRNSQVRRDSAVLQDLTEEELNRGESDTSDAETSSNYSQKRGRNLFRRIARHLSKSSHKSKSSSARRGGPSSARPSIASQVSSEAKSITRSHSSSTKSSSNLSAGSSAGKSVSSASSVATTGYQSDPLGPKRLRLLSITNPVPLIQPSTFSKASNKMLWQHGPTMSAKRGIELEWELVKCRGKDEQWEEDTGSEERRLGQQLLLNQLASKAAMPNRNALPPTMTVEMLVSRWTTVPRRDSNAGAMQESSGSSRQKFNFGNDSRPAYTMRAETTPASSTMPLGVMRQVTT